MTQPVLNNPRHLFLGWDIPPIESLTAWLTAQYSHDGKLDLGSTIIALPAASAVKSLLTQLVNHCQANSLIFFPPTAVTLGHLPEYLYSARPTASASLQALLWADVARKATERDSLDHVFPSPPELTDFTSWFGIGETLANLHTELAGDLQDFKSVINYCEQSGHPTEVKRWTQLADLQRAYLDEVDRLGFWDIQTARMIAVKNSECTTTKNIIIAGCVDVNQTIRGMLNDVSEHLTVVTFAPKSLGARFKDNGALNTVAWQQQPIEISDSQLIMVESPNAQALACANLIAKQSTPDNSQQDFVIACPDAADEPYLFRIFNRQETVLSTPRGRSLHDNIVVNTLRLLGNFVVTKSYSAFAALLRLPDIQHYLANSGITDDLVSLSDEFHEKHLPMLTGKLRGQTGKYIQLAAALQHLDFLVTPLTSETSQLSKWSSAILEVLNSIYGQRLVELNNIQDRSVLCGTRAISQSIARLADADNSSPIQCTVSEFIHLTLESVITQYETSELSAGVALTGWLDVVWGEQSNVLVTSFNEGTIPSSITSDIFLPNSLRTALGLMDNARRFARDAYTTTLLVKSREMTTFFCKRTDAAGMPLWPSRIALTGDAREVAQRLNLFTAVDTDTSSRPPLYHLTSTPSDITTLRFDKVQKTEFTVTEFRDYLSCPTRYYLKHILKLNAIADDAREMTALAFGNLLHDSLNEFGKSKFKDSNNADTIYHFLESQVLSRADQLYGKYSYGVISIQISQLCNRLQAFAEWQAAWKDQGWEIVETEFNCNDGVPISPEHSNLLVLGRIDRIDYHAASSRWSIFDYKSSESCHRPEKIHNCTDPPFWSDLQLPLYRHLAKSVTNSTDVALGYINICNDLTSIGEYFAEWSLEQLTAADLVALNVMESINANKFDAKTNAQPSFYSEYSYLLGDTALDSANRGIESGPQS